LIGGGNPDEGWKDIEIYGEKLFRFGSPTGTFIGACMIDVQPEVQ